MHERGKSDSPGVPAKPLNKAAPAGAEMVEERGLAEENTADKTRPGHRAGPGAPSALARVRQVAQGDKEARFTALLHHVSVDRLRAAYWAIRPTAAPGVDGVTWEAYGQKLEGNLHDLHEGLHMGRYRVKPSRRVYIPKADGRQRPLGIASLEDKIVQRAVVEVLNAIYEADLLGFSYGFRPGRGPRHALDALVVGIERKRVNWVLDADVRDFSTGLIAVGWRGSRAPNCGSAGPASHPKVVERGSHRGRAVVGDCERGTTGGIGITVARERVPALRIDLWAQWWRKRFAHGDVVIVRFADDFTVGFEHEEDAQRFLADLRERFAKFGLELHPDKTRLIEFGKHGARRRRAQGLGKPETFDFLGFTHFCGKTKHGRFWLRRITISKRMQAKLREVNDQLKRRRHQPIPEQGRWLRSVVEGHLAYYAVPGNTDAVAAFRTQVGRCWYKALRRRSQRTRLNWKRMDRLTTKWLPPARKRYPFPDVRFDARIRGGSPVR
jgi:RNA-directed DNA polymerase